VGLIMRPKAPMIYCGGGIISRRSLGRMARVRGAHRHPVATPSWHRLLPEQHELVAQMARHARTVYATTRSTKPTCSRHRRAFRRSRDRKISEFAKHGTIVHIDIDNPRSTRTRSMKLPILSDVKYALGRLNECSEQTGRKARQDRLHRFPDWYAKINDCTKKFPFTFKDTDDVIQPQYAIRLLYELTKATPSSHRRGPAPDVGRAVLRFRQAAHSPHQRRLGRWASAIPRRSAPRWPSPTRKWSYRRRRLVHHERAGTRDGPMSKHQCQVMILNNQWLGMVISGRPLLQIEPRPHLLGNPKKIYEGSLEDPTGIYPDYVRSAKASP